jgi:quercetin dioxygenase-like cupin family protein
MRCRSDVGLVAAAMVVALAACPAGHPGDPVNAPGPVAAVGGIRRTLIDRRPATDLPGWETRLYLIEYPPGVAAPIHVHPAVGVGYVLEGRFESAFGAEPVVEVRAGHGFVDQAGVTHRVFRNASPDQGLRFVVAYTLRVGEEPLHLVDGPAG